MALLFWFQRRSASNIVERIKNLKTEGYIEKRVVLINVQKTRNTFTAFPLVELNNHGKDSIDFFKEELPDIIR